MHGAYNRDTHLYPPHKNSSVFLTTTYVGHTGRATNGIQSGQTTPQDCAFSFQIPVPTLREWPSQGEPGSSSTASAPVSDVSAPACTNGVWPHLWHVSVAQKNKPSTMLSSDVQSIDLLMDCTAWRLWTMWQSNGYSTPVPRSSAAKEWIEELAQQKMINLLFPLGHTAVHGCWLLPRSPGSHRQGMFCCSPSWHVSGWSHQRIGVWGRRSSGKTLVWVASAEVCSH